MVELSRKRREKLNEAREEVKTALLITHKSYQKKQKECREHLKVEKHRNEEMPLKHFKQEFLKISKTESHSF